MQEKQATTMDDLENTGKPSRRDWLLSPPEAAEFLKITVRDLNGLCRSGELRFVRVTPHKRRFRQVDLDEFIDRRLSPNAVDRSQSKALPSGRDVISEGGDRKPRKQADRAELRRKVQSWL